MAAMDSGGSAGGGGPAPFLLKTYEMVDNASSDEIVSWSEGKNSFIVWSPPEFASVLLPTYFKHNNFSSFIRQLNTYGFRKIDPERWEFANDDFVQGKKHLLKNIHRRKPVYSHSLPPGGGDSERAAMEEEIERLTREKTGLEGNLSRFKDQQSTTEFQLKDLDLRLENMEQRQRKMFSFVSRAVQNPVFVDHLLQMSGAMPIDLSEVHKKRRLPGAGEGEAEALQRQISSTTLKPDRLLQRDFSSKLRLGLSSAISDTSIASPRTQSSEEEGFISPQRRQTQPECLSIMPETIELSDSAASGCPKKTPNVQLPWQMRNEDEGDRHISCLLNLTLASSPLQQRESTGEDGHGRKIQNDGSNLAAPAKQTSSAAAPGKPNDKFWEQFLTERPGSSDTEEASSAMKVGSSEEQAEEEREGEKPWRSRREVEGLSL